MTTKLIITIEYAEGTNSSEIREAVSDILGDVLTDENPSVESITVEEQP